LTELSFRRAERCRCDTSVKSTNPCAEADVPPSADPLDEGIIDPAPPVPLPDIALLAYQYIRLGCCVTNGSFLTLGQRSHAAPHFCGKSKPRLHLVIQNTGRPSKVKGEVLGKAGSWRRTVLADQAGMLAKVDRAYDG
jgi:hypothetical protein